MPHRKQVTKKLAELLNVLSHPHRIQIVEELGNGEQSVGQLSDLLEISHSGVSQHLMLLRANHVVAERRQGRNVYYHLEDPDLAIWLLEATRFIESSSAAQELKVAIKKARRDWSH